MKAKFLLAVAMIFFATAVYAQKSHTYLVILPHTAEQCMASMDEIKAKGQDLLSKTYWACHSGDHTAYAIITAESQQAAVNLLPSEAQKTAKVIPVEQFTVEQIEMMHKEGK